MENTTFKRGYKLAGYRHRIDNPDAIVGLFECKGEYASIGLTKSDKATFGCFPAIIEFNGDAPVAAYIDTRKEVSENA